MKPEYGLHSDIRSLPGIGPKKAEALTRLGIRTVSELLYHFPREYRDWRKQTEIRDLRDDQKALVCAKVLMIIKGKGYGRRRTLRLLVEDRTGQMEILFFMSGYMDQAFQQGRSYLFYGKVQVDRGRTRMLHPDHVPAEQETVKRIRPVYPLTGGITQKDLRKQIEGILSKNILETETLPDPIIRKKNLCSIAHALKNIHFPEDEQKYKEARYRLVYEELFFLQTALQLSRARFGKGRSGIAFSASVRMNDFVKVLPYTPTRAQERVLADTEQDMESAEAMNRLIQGDVGSGKTLIAQAALFKATKSGYQGAFMAPTELLARQHFETLQADLGPLDVRVGFLSGSLSAKAKKQTMRDLESGRIDVIVGTHAIVSEGVRFHDLGLVITDEQHRFGVTQRLLLSQKGKNPDVLVMTATPIPRTLAIVLYGDLDISVIDEMPPGRIPIKTIQYTQDDREHAYSLLRKEILRGRQAYVVAPLIDDSESLESRSAESLFHEMCNRFPDLSCALLHGNLPQSEKDRIMDRFYRGHIGVLISTVVIEVGINVPNATIMLIENAERFGLAQLHQLRGRVGRGNEQSYCLIVSGTQSDIAEARAAVFCETNDGFLIAEKDLELRGAGEVFGVRQHGLPELRLADPVKHYHIFTESREDAVELLRNDPDLSSEENRAFGRCLHKKFVQTENIVL
ncbi:MAG: ATP-dependent DNA helicase RecG [Eubacteriales bacterium]|nr:ATP-dependent DNA helicase RecG [Eubacteriales bacterium]